MKMFIGMILMGALLALDCYGLYKYSNSHPGILNDMFNKDEKDKSFNPQEMIAFLLCVAAIILATMFMFMFIGVFLE